MHTIYLAAPYTHKSRRVMRKRFIAANKLAAYLYDNGHNVYSPLTHSVLISHYTKAQTDDSEYWVDRVAQFIKSCDTFVVLQLPGWEESQGIAKETRIAKSLGMPVVYWTPEPELLGGVWGRIKKWLNIMRKTEKSGT